MNRHLDDGLETIFLMPNEKYFFTSSSLIKQVANYTARDTGLVPDNVRKALAVRLAPTINLGYAQKKSHEKRNIIKR